MYTVSRFKDKLCCVRMIDCLRENPSSTHQVRVVPDNRHPLQSSASETSVGCERGVAASDDMMTSQSATRKLSYLHAVNRSDELVYRDSDLKMKLARCYKDVLVETSRMYPISENEEYQQLNLSAESAVPQHRSTDSRLIDSSRVKAGTNGIEVKDGGRGRSGNHADLWEWCKETATDSGAADIRTYIRRDDVRKVLQLRGQKMAARKSAAQLSQKDSAANHHPLSSQKCCINHQNRSSGVPSRLAESQLGSSTGYRSSAELRPNTDVVDSVSIGSQKDSGYRSEEDRHSGDSPTLSNSAVSLSSTATSREATEYPDVKSLCSSYESLCSVQSGYSLPVGIETRLRTVPESLHTTVSEEPKDFFTRSARTMAVYGQRQPMNAEHSAIMNSKYRPMSGSSYQLNESTSRSDGRRHVSQIPGSVNGSSLNNSDGYLRHAESVPVISHLCGSDAAVHHPDGQYRRSTTACTSHDMVPPYGGQSVLHQGDQGRVHGRGYFRDTDAVVPAFRHPPTSKPPDYKQLIRHSALSTSKPPHK